MITATVFIKPLKIPCRKLVRQIKIYNYDINSNVIWLICFTVSLIFYYLLKMLRNNIYFLVFIKNLE